MSAENMFQDIVNESNERGERLRRIRNLANLSRKELCDESGVNINTYIGYEVGRYGGLTKNGANKIIKYIALKGVYCSLEWLMCGEGVGPRVETDIQQKFPEGNYKILDEKEKISEEISLFRKHYNKSCVYQIIDDGMLPIYSVGDYVAGVPYMLFTSDELVGSNCIVQMDGGEIMVRNLRHSKIKNHYTLFCINPETNIEQPIIYDVKLIFAAKIIWHRKLYLTEENSQEKDMHSVN